MLYLAIGFGLAVAIVSAFARWVQPLTPFAFMISMLALAVVLVLGLLASDFAQHGLDYMAK